LVKNNEVDAGFEYYWGLFGIKGNLFYSDLTDYIYLTSINPIRYETKPALSYQNIDAHIYGGDITAVGMLTDTVSVEAGVAYQRGKKDSGNYTDSDLAEIPPLKTRLAVKYDNGTVFGQVEGIYASPQEDVDTDLNEQKTGIDNLFDKNYYTHLSYLRNPFSSGSKVPEPGRFVYMNVSYKF